MNDHIQEGSWEDFGAGACPKFPDSPKVQYAGGWLKLPGVAAIKVPNQKHLFVRCALDDSDVVEIIFKSVVLFRGAPTPMLDIWEQVVDLVPMISDERNAYPLPVNPGGWARSAQKLIQEILVEGLDPDNDPT